MNPPEHRHPEIEDRITDEMTLVHTELREVNQRIDLLRQDTRQGFSTVQVLLSEQGDTLRQILELLGRPNGDGTSDAD